MQGRMSDQSSCGIARTGEHLRAIAVVVVVALLLALWLGVLGLVQFVLRPRSGLVSGGGPVRVVLLLFGARGRHGQSAMIDALSMDEKKKKEKVQESSIDSAQTTHQRSRRVTLFWLRGRAPHASVMSWGNSQAATRLEGTRRVARPTALDRARCSVDRRHQPIRALIDGPGCLER
ncbi:hypothetical protein VTK73DRAFT_3335 [Phialemonium thermophilum]|uniref:Uncharacterized protein n=1 Tax=Phialemonium thermophilum TaxID=223376 RepID=A0ABR3VJW9_9PEZI